MENQKISDILKLLVLIFYPEFARLLDLQSAYHLISFKILICLKPAGTECVLSSFVHIFWFIEEITQNEIFHVSTK